MGGGAAGDEVEEGCIDRFGNILVPPQGCTCKMAKKNKCEGICRDPKNNGAEVNIPEGCNCKAALKNKCPPPEGFCFHKARTSDYTDTRTFNNPQFRSSKSSLRRFAATEKQI